MFGAFNKLFRKAEDPKEPFIDPVLGEFNFDAELGWKKIVSLAGKEAELILGSDGEVPPDKMLRAARAWVKEWPVQFPKIVEYVAHELREWNDEPNLPDPGKFEVESINFLWKDKPTTCLIYFRNPGDDIRVWHATFEGFEPCGFAYDD
jgi:hypothetical protein